MLVTVSVLLRDGLSQEYRLQFFAPLVDGDDYLVTLLVVEAVEYTATPKVGSEPFELLMRDIKRRAPLGACGRGDLRDVDPTAPKLRHDLLPSDALLLYQPRG
jgi:hypothetical protein